MVILHCFSVSFLLKNDDELNTFIYKIAPYNQYPLCKAVFGRK